MNKQHKVFVTGAAGFIGTKLVQLLLREGFSVRGLYHRKPPDWSNFGDINRRSEIEGSHDRLQFVQGDITSLESLRQAMEGCRYAFHLAGFAKNWARDFSIFTKINVDGMRNVFQVAKDQNYERIVWTSSIVTFGPTEPGTMADEASPRITEQYFTEYEKTKTVAEKEALQWATDGLPLVIVNPTRVFGPGPHTDGNALAGLIHDYISGKLFVMFNFGMNTGNYVFVDDVAQGHYLAMLKGRIGERYILGSENASLRQFYTYVEEVSGIRRRGLPIFIPGAMMIARLFVLWAKLAGGYPRISPGWVKTFATDWCHSSDKAKTELGYDPIPLKEAVRRTYEWLKEKNTQNPE
ncbi:MAG: NAD-dependent epimerase/dehydratase family protein [Planctomycetaceae bacterium]|nr:NAD-dependent epimerase/dehydratase family protein [Planctomycetaceae bacterium]